MPDETHWTEFWERLGVYAHDPTRPREETFVVDTPPPTVSGSLHIGHMFSYTHTDLMVRYRRMRGQNILYRMGWDDNGLPTDRRVQNVFNVRCDTTLPHDPKLRVTRGRGGDPLMISRTNYLELCDQLLVEDEAAFKALFTRLGLSLDWSHTYATIDRQCRRASQWSFLDLVDRGEAVSREAVTMWDADFQTAVAQAEVEDRPRPGELHPIRFAVDGGGEFVIATTRPELLPACIAVTAHPRDERYRDLFGRSAITPLFSAPVPIIAHEAADPEKGTGIMMVCTFGDIADVERWREWDVPVREVIGRDGRMRSAPWGSEPWTSLAPDVAARNHERITGLRVNAARREIVAMLDKAGALAGPPQTVERQVRFYEKGEHPLEFVTSRQWFIRLLEHRDALIQQGRRIHWHPEMFLKRYENWVQGLNQDWCVSRQRPFGVPIPIWYAIDEAGNVRYDQPIIPARDALPVDPASEAPAGYDEEQRGQPRGFSGDPDVFDTWATAALTPQIVAGWPDTPNLAHRYPADLRPQAHEIIRTWAFYSITRAYLQDGGLPFHHVAISGFVVDPDRKKMSKSKGNVIVPTEVFDLHGADAVRYWSASASLGVDAINDPNVFREGKRLVTKIRNASRFVLSLSGDPTVPSNILDLALLAQLRALLERVGRAWDQWDHAAALRDIESWFWSSFCDNYIELVKERAYAGDGSALATLRLALDILLRLFAPFVPFVAEEVWQGEGRDRLPSVMQHHEESIHRMAYPTPGELPTERGEEHFEVARDVLARIRRAKSEARVSVGAPVRHLRITVGRDDAGALDAVLSDVLAAGRVESHELVIGNGDVDPSVDLQLV